MILRNLANAVLHSENYHAELENVLIHIFYAFAFLSILKKMGGGGEEAVQLNSIETQFWL